MAFNCTHFIEKFISVKSPPLTNFKAKKQGLLCRDFVDLKRPSSLLQLPLEI